VTEPRVAVAPTKAAVQPSADDQMEWAKAHYRAMKPEFQTLTTTGVAQNYSPTIVSGGAAMNYNAAQLNRT